MQYSKGEYFYKIIAPDLRYVSLLKNDPQKFVNMSKILVDSTTSSIDSTDSDLTLILNNKSCKITFVSMDKQLHDFMFEFPSQKTWLIKVRNF